MAEPTEAWRCPSCPTRWHRALGQGGVVEHNTCKFRVIVYITFHTPPPTYIYPPRILWASDRPSARGAGDHVLMRLPTGVRPPLVQTFLLLLSLPRAKPITVGPDTKPHVNGNRILLDGGVHAWQGPSTDVLSPIQDAETGKRSVIGTLSRASPRATAHVECGLAHGAAVAAPPWRLLVVTVDSRAEGTKTLRAALVSRITKPAQLQVFAGPVRGGWSPRRGSVRTRAGGPEPPSPAQ